MGQYGGFANCARGITPTAPACFVPGLPVNRYILRDGGNPYDIADFRLQNQNSNSPLDKSNTNLQTDLRTPLEGKKLYVDGLFNITDDVHFRTNFLYANRLSNRTVAGYPMQSGSFAQTAGGLSVNSYYNPLGNWHAPAGTTPQSISSWWRRSWEVPRLSSSELDTYRFSGAFEGSFEIGSHYFDWDVGYLHNTNKLLQNTFGNWNLANTGAATGPSFLNSQGRVQCGTPSAPISFATCVPFNPFLAFGVAGDGSLGQEDLQRFLFQEEHATGKTKTEVYSANLAGLVIPLPAGDLGFAVGYEHRKESGAFSPDTLAQTGGSSNLAAGPTGGGYSVDEAYAELQVPILADLPFAKELSINVAGRYSDFDTFGDTTNLKAGFKWRPLDTLLFRGTWAEGFRAPTIAGLYGGGSQTFPFYTDPCDVQFGASRDAGSSARANCRTALGAAADTFRQLGQGFTPVTASNTQSPVAFVQGSNPLLQPETSVSKTVGTVWSPHFVDGLTLGLDWWQIRIDETIVSDSPGQILSDCYVDGLTARCGLITRDPALGYVSSLLYGTRNAGYRETEGYDLDVSYRLPTENWGSFNIAWNSTYTSRDEFVTTRDPVRYPSQNVGFTSSFRIRSTLAVNWDIGDFGVGWNARYFSGMKEACLGAAAYPDECSNPIYQYPGLQGNLVTSTYDLKGSTTFHDLQFRWNAPWNATVSVGANNAFNKVGPVMYSMPSANVSYYGGFDIGRFYYARYTQRF